MSVKTCCFTAFLCVLTGKPMVIPTSIEGKYVRFAEEITEISYSQSETFGSVSISRDISLLTTY